MSDSRQKPRIFFLHLVSDATGTTLLGLVRACLAQFRNVEPNQKFWPLVRTEKQLENILPKISENPGPVIFTFVNEKMRRRLQDHCEHLGVPCVGVLDPIIHGLSSYLGMVAEGIPGLQHTMDEAYFKRVSAIDFALRFDDGKCRKGLTQAEVVLVGVSRTSKTPTSVYLARRGIRAANIPLVPGVDIPEETFSLERPLYVGLTASPERLVHLRRTRLSSDNDSDHVLQAENEYLDLEKIEQEVRDARRLFSRHGWPVIDVTKRSIEETAAEIIRLLQAKRDKEGEDGDGSILLDDADDGAL